jgi:hypothetical protein
MEEFLANGMNTFGDVGYGVMRERIDQTTLDCSLLIGGFDQADRACIFSVEEPGTVHDFAGIGYWAIGSGALNALGRLSIRKQRSGLSIEQTIYNVYEAKIAAESAFGVGPTTNLFVVRPDGVAYTLGKEIPEAIREECKRNLTPTITPTLLRQVHDTAKIALAEVTEEARQALPETTHDQPGQLPSRE